MAVIFPQYAENYRHNHRHKEKFYEYPKICFYPFSLCCLHSALHVHRWYPNFGGFYAPPNKDENFDPATLFIYPEDAMEDITFTDTVYIRGIWATDGKRPAAYLFGFDTSPLIEVTID